jgi:hypothetical protein
MEEDKRGPAGDLREPQEIMTPAYLYATANCAPLDRQTIRFRAYPVKIEGQEAAQGTIFKYFGANFVACMHPMPRHSPLCNTVVLTLKTNPDPLSSPMILLSAADAIGTARLPLPVRLIGPKSVAIASTMPTTIESATGLTAAGFHGPSWRSPWSLTERRVVTLVLGGITLGV